MAKSLISADSHVTEHPDCYVTRVDRRYRDRAPHLVFDPKMGDTIVMEGIRPLVLSLASAAGEAPEELLTKRGEEARFERLPKGGWETEARLKAQDRDGVSAEILYPTVGMEVCNLADVPLKKACMDAYNLWVAEFAASAPERLFALGMTPMRDVDESIDDLRTMKRLGMVGVMLPGWPALSDHDYDHEVFDPFWEACVDLDLPPSFHILTAGDGASLGAQRGHKLNSFMAVIRANQDIMGMMVLGGVFERNPRLRVVCVEADAGWVPHYLHRIDHGYEYHRHWMRARPLERMPSEYFLEHIYLTFQDDAPALRYRDDLNLHRLLWANDYPHPDSTWPISRPLLYEHTRGFTEAERDAVVHDNTAALYRLPL